MNAKAADFVLLTVSDIGESVTFYRDTLGLDFETIDEEARLERTVELVEENLRAYDEDNKRRL